LSWASPETLEVRACSQGELEWPKASRHFGWNPHPDQRSRPGFLLLRCRVVASTARIDMLPSNSLMDLLLQWVPGAQASGYGPLSRWRLQSSSILSSFVLLNDGAAIADGSRLWWEVSIPLGL